MSRHRAFDASRHRGRIASRHRSYGTGVRFFDFPFSEDVELTLEAWKRTLTGLGTGSVSMSPQTPTTIAVHDRWYHHCMTMMMSSSMRGTSRIGSFNSKGYSGVIDPQNDDVSDVTEDLDLSISGFSWNGWFDYPGGVYEQTGYNKTANSIEFYGRLQAFHSGLGSGSVANIMTYGPWTDLFFTGSSWQRDVSLEWIMFYFPGVNASATTNVDPVTTTRTLVDVKMVITVP